MNLLSNLLFNNFDFKERKQKGEEDHAETPTFFEFLLFLESRCLSFSPFLAPCVVVTPQPSGSELRRRDGQREAKASQSKKKERKRVSGKTVRTPGLCGRGEREREKERE